MGRKSPHCEWKFSVIKKKRNKKHVGFKINKVISQEWQKSHLTEQKLMIFGTKNKKKTSVLKFIFIYLLKTQHRKQT